MQSDLTIEMEIMITENVSTAPNLANRSRGKITDILLDLREPPLNVVDRTAHLTYLPYYIMLQLITFKLPSLSGLQAWETPLSPITCHFYVGSKPQSKITWQQLPITPAYAFTDFKSQGQTIENLIVDIGKTTSLGLTPFNAYVALSCCHGRNSICLLQDFNNDLFTKHPSDDLWEEDVHLEILSFGDKRKIWSQTVWSHYSTTK